MRIATSSDSISFIEKVVKKIPPYPSGNPSLSKGRINGLINLLSQESGKLWGKKERVVDQNCYPYQTGVLAEQAAQLAPPKPHHP
jgi:hypothetical protein